MASSKHRARRRSVARSRPLSLLLAASAIAAAVTGGAMLSGGTYALWSQSRTVPTVTVTAGSLAITASSSFTATLWQTLIPGERVRQSFTVSNSGSVPAAVTATATTGATGFEVRLATGACPATDLTGASATTVAAALGTVAAHSTVAVCLEVALTAAASPGDQSAFSVALTGTQTH